MRVNGLIVLGISLADSMGVRVEKLFLSLKSYLFSTRLLPCKPDEQAVFKRFRLFFLLFLFLPLYLKAQPGLENKVKIRMNDPEVMVSVDRPDATKGETVTLTIAAIPEGYQAVVTAGKIFGEDESAWDLQLTAFSSGTAVFTFTMPEYAVYIDIKVEVKDSASQLYALTVETPGVAADQVSVTIEGGGVTGNASSGYRAEAGREVTVTLQTPLADRLTLTGTEAFAPDGSWRWVSLSGSRTATSLTFTMPAAAVTVRFSIWEDTTPPMPPIPPTANESAGLSGLSLCTVDGTVNIVSDRDYEAFVYTFGGRTVRRLRLVAGSEQQFTLPHGAYILRAGNRTVKFHL